MHIEVGGAPAGNQDRVEAAKKIIVLSRKNQYLTLACANSADVIVIGCDERLDRYQLQFGDAI